MNWFDRLFEGIFECSHELNKKSLTMRPTPKEETPDPSDDD